MNFPLTAIEMQMVSDKELILTKIKIIQKVCNLFGHLAEEYKKEAVKVLPATQFINAKISKGENYQSLPYVILDFPRHFGKADVFAIRSLFWWGNFFSITLHLQGQYQQQYASVLENATGKGLFDGWYIASSSNQWQHHFDNGNYALINEGFHYKIKDLPFLKLAKKIPINKWDEAETFFTENFRLLINSLGGYAPIL